MGPGGGRCCTGEAGKKVPEVFVECLCLYVFILVTWLLSNYMESMEKGS